MLAELNLVQGGIATIATIVIVVVVFLLLYMVFSRYTKVGPNQVLIVSGNKHKLEDGSTDVDVLDLSATYGDPAGATQLANTYASEFKDYNADRQKEKLEAGGFETALVRVQR